MARFLSCTHTATDVARLAIGAYEKAILDARAANPRRPRRRKAVAR
jgi:hypothetical protein